MKFFKFYSLLFIATMVGCSPLTTTVKTDTTAFYQPSFKSEGSVVVLPGDISLDNSLEFDLYRQKVEEKLSAEGFSIADNIEAADFAALVLYAVDDGKQSVVYSPVYGQTGRRINSYSDIVYDADGRAVYIRRNYLSPDFGVVGASANTKTNYRQTIALDIVEADSLSDDKPKKLFEGRTISSGQCSVMVEVFDELLEAMFSDFPGDNGRNRRQTVDSVTNCS